MWKPISAAEGAASFNARAAARLYNSLPHAEGVPRVAAPGCCVQVAARCVNREPVLFADGVDAEQVRAIADHHDVLQAVDARNHREMLRGQRSVVGMRRRHHGWLHPGGRIAQVHGVERKQHGVRLDENAVGARGAQQVLLALRANAVAGPTMPPDSVARSRLSRSVLMKTSAHGHTPMAAASREV